MSSGRDDPGLEAVLVDMDGTLLDSERVWDVALDQLAAWLGGELSQGARVHMVGSSLPVSVAILHDDLGIDADPETSGAYLAARAEALFRTDLTWKPGARELLAELRAADVPIGLVTSTHRRMADIALDFMGRDWFHATVCGDEVGYNKPHPEPYQRAAGLLGVDLRRCVVIEDSPMGIESGEASGAAVVAVPSEVPIAAGPKRTLFASLTEVSLDVLRQLSIDWNVEASSPG